jgi:2-dehydropantoate 2-reductase
MRVAVFGAGGAGGYFGGRLAQAGEEVIFIARGEHLRALQSQGLWVESIKGDFRLKPIQATANPAEVGTVDFILLGVKAWQVPEAAGAILPMIGSHTAAVPLENGVEAPEQLAFVLGQQHVLGGLCQIVSILVEPGHIRHSGIDPLIAFGELDGSTSRRVENLRAAFEGAAGVRVETPVDIRLAMWNKFLFIAAFSGVGAVTRAPAGDMRRIPETRRLLQQALEEVAAVGYAKGLNLGEADVVRTLAFIDSLPEGTTASMQRDILAGRPSELEAQNGAVVRMGVEVGVPTPAHGFIYASLLPQDQRARGETSF